MTDFPASSFNDKHATAFTWTGRVPEAYQRSAQDLLDEDSICVNTIGALTAPADEFAEFGTAAGGLPAPVSVDYPALASDRLTPAFDWFEDFHVLPRSIHLGNVVSAVSIPLEVYSAYRDTIEEWLAFTNNAGAGLSLGGQPPLPFAVAPQSGLSLTVDVSPSGVPRVDTTLDFEVPEGTIFVPITLDRVTLLALRPELPYVEFLEFLTDVIPHVDGTEQRHSLRAYPRQLFEWELLVEEGPEAARLDNILFDWQPRIFGVPQWHEMTSTTAAAIVGATTFTVRSTADADYRVGGLVLVYSGDAVYDVLELVSLTSTTVTTASGALNAYPVGSIVAPLRTGVIDRQIDGARHPVNAQFRRVRIVVEDNAADLASTAGFPSLLGKVLLSDANIVRGTFPEVLERAVTVLDGATGRFVQDSNWDRSRRVSQKTFLCRSQAQLWNVRRLLHALRGRQISFYLPTFARDLLPTANLASGQNTLQVAHVGYTQFVRARQPKNLIQILRTDGTTLTRGIASSSVLDASNETLVVDSAWGSTITPAQISRVSYIEKVRLESDVIRIDHSIGDRISRVSSPVKVVLE